MFEVNVKKRDKGGGGEKGRRRTSSGLVLEQVLV